MRLFSTEQVSKYHPDKYADQISDSIVALALTKNKNARCAVETLVKNDTVVVAGEIGNVELNNDEIEYAVKTVARELNYHVSRVINLLDVQSAEISGAVENENGDIGAGDQGFMVGYATRETDSYLPYAFDLANKIIERIEKSAITSGIFKGDAKTQVTVDLDTNEIKKVLVSVAHYEEFDLEFVQNCVKRLLGELVDPELLIVNPAGRWTVDGAVADCGLTGRKIVCDQYGGYTAVGGGAFSGKDLSKVDRSGAYVARNIAIDVLKKYGVVNNVEIQLAYAIGLSKPMSVNVKTDVPELDNEILNYIEANYDLRPRSMIRKLGLKPGDYPKLASGCHYKNGYVGSWEDI
ncbi:MAG: methionine adenosyltransferase domain-containing protein [Acholeplasmataceae bacterium]